MSDLLSVDAEIGATVHQRMWAAKITGTQLAEALGIDAASVSRRLRGQIPWRVTDIICAAELLGCEPADLIPLREKGTAAEFRCTARSAVSLRLVAGGLPANVARQVVRSHDLIFNHLRIAR